MGSNLPIGETLSLLTAVCFAASVVLFSRAGARIGSMNLNPIRLAMGFGFLSLYGVLVRGHALPSDATVENWKWLSLSGVVGFVFGDLFLFRALIDIGPRLSALLMSLAPLFTAIVGYLFLRERLDYQAVIGMAMTVGGIGIAVLDRPTRREPISTRQRRRGLVFGVLGAVGQAVGLVFSKRGMGGYDAFASTQIRILAALAVFGLIFVTLRRGPSLSESLRDGPAMRLAALGAFVGPFAGVGMSLLAVQYIETGVAASLMATTPIVVMPVAWAMGDRPGFLGFLGTSLAVMGVVCLFLR